MENPEETEAGNNDKNLRSSLDGRRVLYDEFRDRSLPAPVVFDRVKPKGERGGCNHVRQGIAYLCDKCGYLVVLEATQADKDGKGVPQSIRCPRPGCGGTLRPSYRKCLICGVVLEWY